MNRTIKVIISIVLCVWIFAMGLELGAFRERRAINASLSGNGSQTATTQSNNSNIIINTITEAPTTTAAPQTTQAPSTTAAAESTTQAATETTAAATESDSTTDADESTEATETTAADESTEATETTAATETTEAASAVPKTNEEIAEAFSKAMNNTKHTTKSCNAVKNTDVQITVTDCSVSSLRGMVNNIVQGFTGPETKEYSFVNGVADGDVTLYGDLPPSGRDVSLDAGGIASASAEPYGNNGYKLTITLIPESSSLGNEPKYHANSVGFLDIESLGISGVSFTEANFNYSGATVTVAVNDEGLIDSYDCKLPLAGTGAASVKIASASASLEGSSNESWQFTWL